MFIKTFSEYSLFREYLCDSRYVGDKDIRNTLRPLKHHVDHWYLCDLTEERSAKAENLKQSLLDLEMNQTILEFSSPISHFNGFQSVEKK